MLQATALLSSQQLNRTEDRTSIKLLEQRMLQVPELSIDAKRTIAQKFHGRKSTCGCS